MKRKLFIALIIIQFGAYLSCVYAQGSFRERIKERIRERLAKRQRAANNFGAGDHDFSLVHAGLTRKYKVHIPQSYDKNKRGSVVLAFHGGGGNAKDSIDYFQLNGKSDKEGFIVVYPEGTGLLIKRKVLGSWNAGRCCPPPSDNNVDDVGFIEKMIEKLKSDFNIDENRIFATGASNGAIMCYRLACELSDKIAAIAPVAAHDAFDDCKPKRPLSVIHFHGTDDPCAPYNGGSCGGCMANLLTGETKELWSCTSVPNYIDKWRQMNRCSDKTKITFQNGDATCITYQGCQDNAEVTLCTIDGMGHTWPGGTASYGEACRRNPDGYMCRRLKETMGASSDDIIANDAMWEFFKRHHKK